MKYLKLISIFIISILFITFIVSILNLFNIESGIIDIILLIFNGILFFILNYINSKNIDKNGLLNGFILSIIFILIMYILNGFIYTFSIKLSTIIYYLILLLIGIFSSIIGINNKKEEDN